MAAVMHECMDELTVAQAVSLLKSYQISPTQQRVLVAQVLLTKSQHVSADQVMDMVNCYSYKVSKATIYNTLGLFARKGLIRELVIDPAKVFYDTNVAEHHHFYNVDTGELTDIEQMDLEVSGLPASPTGTRPVGMDIVVRVRGVA